MGGRRERMIVSEPKNGTDTIPVQLNENSIDIADRQQRLFLKGKAWVRFR
jgi:hypothetical protein